MQAHFNEQAKDPLRSEVRWFLHVNEFTGKDFCNESRNEDRYNVTTVQWYRYEAHRQNSY